MTVKYYTDPSGDKVAAKYVGPYDRKRDQIANQISSLWLKEEERLNVIKEKTVELIEKLQEAAARDTGVKPLGGKKGNIQFRSFDGRITIALDNAKRTEFDERLSIAQSLIMEAVQELSAGEHSADLVEIATRAFQPRKSGNLDMQRIRDLKNYQVKHPKWKQAMDIITKCERVIGHRQYVRVSIRDTEDKAPRSIILDIAKV